MAEQGYAVWWGVRAWRIWGARCGGECGRGGSGVRGVVGSAGMAEQRLGGVAGSVVGLRGLGRVVSGVWKRVG